jgi:dephospho-CoA kinase
MQKKISVFGEMRTGKDTAAARIMEKESFNKFAYGDKLKEHYHAIFGTSEGKDRTGYQWFGQTMRSFRPSIWIDRLNDKMQPSIDAGDNVIVTDMRQPNEYKHLKDLGFVMIKVTTSPEVRAERMKTLGDQFTNENMQHETERNVRFFIADYTIENNGTLEEFEAEIDRVYADIIAKGENADA